MTSKSSDLLKNSYVIMINDETDYQPLVVNEDIISDSEYEPVIMNEQGQSNIDDDNEEVVQEIYETDINIEHSDNPWYHDAVRFLIYCWGQLKDDFTKCSDKKKKLLWHKVSERMVQDGYYFDALACETKWHSLEKIYTYNRTHTTEKDRHAINWKYFWDIDRVVQDDHMSDIDDVDDDDDDDNDDDEDEDGNDEYSGYENANSTCSTRDVDKCQWTIDSTRELIRLYDKERKKFTTVNQGSKHLLWEEIARQMSNIGYQCSANSCSDKWRNLKMTYKNNKQRELKCGLEYVKWIFFKDLDNIFQSSQESSEHELITVSLEDDNVIKLKKEDEDLYLSTPNANINNENIENSEEMLGTSEIWTEAATKCLIDFWGHYRPRFLMAPQGKKRLLWNDISKELRQHGHNYSGVVCDRKWRLLKANYIKRREKYKKLGVNSVKWQYYHDIDRLLGVPVETVSWNMDSTMCLIDCFDNHKEKFMKAATGEKILIWKEISEEMKKIGYNYSPRACDNKWRTLKNRYHKNRMRADRNKKVIWVYYNKIDSILKELEKESNPKFKETNNSNNQVNENNEKCEHNYIKTHARHDCLVKSEAIAELQVFFKSRSQEFDQRLKEIENNQKCRDKVFQDLQQQTLDALKKANELEVHKLKLLEQLVSRLPRIVNN